MKKRVKSLNYITTDKNYTSCVLCDSKDSSVTYLGKPVCEECLQYVKTNFK